MASVRFVLLIAHRASAPIAQAGPMAWPTTIAPNTSSRDTNVAPILAVAVGASLLIAAMAYVASWANRRPLPPSAQSGELRPTDATAQQDTPEDLHNAASAVARPRVRGLRH